MYKAEQANAVNILMSALAEFRCTKDADIECFLRKNAVDFQKRGLCSVYLLCDKDLFDNNIISIQAYFTLSHKILSIPIDNADVSKSVRGKLTKNRTAELFHFVLIGQLGKRIDVNTKSSVTGKEILEAALEVINASSDLIVCKAVLVECNKDDDHKKVNDFYINNGFKFLQSDKLNQYYYLI